MALPGPMSFPDYEVYRTSPDLWLGDAKAIASRHSVDTSTTEVFSNGSNLVVGFESDLILKIFPPMLKHQFVSEQTTLSVIQGKLSVPIPEVRFQGEQDGWSYLGLTRLQGQNGEAVWKQLHHDQKVRVMAQIGRVIAEVQAIEPGPIADLDPKWREFLPKQIAGCRARHTRLGLPTRYVDGLDPYLSQAAQVVPTEVKPVILTGEYIPENFLLCSSNGEWEIAGLFDFGDVMSGFGEYDLIGPSVFMGAGDPSLIRSLLVGYGYTAGQIDSRLVKRLMSLFLLHRYSEPLRQLQIDGWQTRAQTLEEMEKLIWPI